MYIDIPLVKWRDFVNEPKTTSGIIMISKPHQSLGRGIFISCIRLHNFFKFEALLECGKNVKCDNAPVYANMGYGKFSGVGVADDKKKILSYKKKANPIK